MGMAQIPPRAESAEMSGRPEAVSAVVFGSIVALGSILLIVTPIGRHSMTRGITGALGLPVWAVGLLLLVFGVYLIVSGVRMRFDDDPKAGRDENGPTPTD
jgi:Na+/alanine symporter